MKILSLVTHTDMVSILLFNRNHLQKASRTNLYDTWALADGRTLITISHSPYLIYPPDKELWPTDAAGKTLSDKEQTGVILAFKTNKKLPLVLAKFLEQLNMYWPNFSSNTNDNFWTHEYWAKHGSTGAAGNTFKIESAKRSQHFILK
ncbi:hypothetical protein QYF36_007716 [Acer negundo]|nr:hypothetical protein QYF36_007716 [Acer negundo]